MEMSFGSPIILVGLLLLIFNFIELRYLLVIIPVIYFFNFISSIIFYRVKNFNVFLRSLVSGLVVFMLLYAIYYSFSLEHTWIISITSGISMAYLTLDYEGWSPLVKFNYGYKTTPTIKVDHNLCVGCKKCTEVCPKTVFRIIDGKSEVIDEKECVFCKACFKQCKYNAIEHSMDISE